MKVLHFVVISIILILCVIFTIKIVHGLKEKHIISSKLKKTNNTKRKNKESYVPESTGHFNTLPTIDENGKMSEIGFPDGMITPFIGIMSDLENLNGWVLCDGRNGTPDLRGRFIRMATLGVNNSSIREHNYNEMGGSDLVMAETENLPPHKHKMYNFWLNAGVAEQNQPSNADIGSKKISVRDNNDNSPYYSGKNKMITSEFGFSSSAILGEENQPPYSTVFFIMKKTNSQKLRYGSTINIKTENGLFLKVNQNDTKELDISYNALPTLHTHAFTIERAPIQDTIGKYHNENEEYVKYGDPIYIKSRYTNNFLFRANKTSIQGNAGGNWDSQAFKIESWDSNKSVYILLGDSVLIKNFSANQGDSYFYVSTDSTKGNMPYLYPYGNGDRRDYVQKFTLNPINQVMNIKEGIVTNHNTPFGDECGGNIACLDKHNVQCPEGTSLKQFNVSRNGKGFYRYNYKCQKTPYILKKEKDNMPPDSGVEDNGWIYVGNKAIHRGNSDQGFANTYYNNQVAARQACVTDPNCGGIMRGPQGNYWGKKQSVVDDYMINNKNKNWDTNHGLGWQFWVKKRNGDVRNLKTTPVQCSIGAISNFNLKRQTTTNPVAATGKFKIAYACNKMKLSDRSVHYTPWRDDGLGKSVYLDQHNLSCPAGKIMTNFVLETNDYNKIRFKYGCANPNQLSP